MVSTRGSSTSTSNAFTPVPVDVPAGPMPLTERVTSLRDLLRRKREEVHGDGPLASVAALANLLPTSVVTGIARSQAGHIDFATSNLPGYLGDSFVAAFNLTAYSTAGCLDLGINADPAAVAEPERLRSCMEAAYADLIAAGASRGPAQARARKRTPR